MFVTHLESALDGTRFPPGQVYSVYQGRPLVVKYDLAAVKQAVQRDTLAARAPSLWRYRELLPLPESDIPVSFGEGMSPILACPRLGKELGLPLLFVKDESQLPTGSFKSRGMAVAVSMAKHLGLTHLAVPSA
jgi:threonine synthase